MGGGNERKTPECMCARVFAWLSFSHLCLQEALDTLSGGHDRGGEEGRESTSKCKLPHLTVLDCVVVTEDLLSIAAIPKRMSLRV